MDGIAELDATVTTGYIVISDGTGADTTGEIEFSGGTDLDDSNIVMLAPSIGSTIAVNADGAVYWNNPKNFKLSVLGDIQIDGRIEFDGVALTAQDVKDFKHHIKHHFKQEADMWTAWNIFIVAVICVVVTKLVIPNLTVKNVAKFFAKVIYWPFKRAATKVETEINNAIDEEEKNS